VYGNSVVPADDEEFRTMATAWYTPGAILTERAQTEDVFGAAQRKEQDPPQSMPSSPWFRRPSVHDGGV